MLGVQCRMARAAVGWRVRDLAETAQVAADVIARLESGEAVPFATVEALRVALEAAGVEFIPENGGGPGVRLKYNRQDVRSIGKLEGEGGIVGEDDV